MNLAQTLEAHRQKVTPMFDPALTASNTIPIDLSVDNAEFRGLSPQQWDQAIEDKINGAGAVAAVGGYLERRAIYQDTPNFEGEAERDVHIGIDVFMPFGTAVHAPLDGEIACFANRQEIGDYGPVIILRHRLDGLEFHSLYGHLTEDSLQGLEPGMAIEAGGRVAKIGQRPRNGDWPTHLHFQLIVDLQGLGDNYPGVARASDLDFYRRNCPDPMGLIVA